MVTKVESLTSVAQPPKKESFGQLLELVVEGQNYAEFFGTFRPETPDDMLRLKRKVDACFEKCTAWEAEAAGYAGEGQYYLDLAKPHTDKARALRNKSDGLKTYMVMQMREAGFERIPGETHAAVLNVSKVPATKFGRDCEAADAAKFGPLVSVTPRQYNWDLKEACVKLKAITKKIDGGEALDDFEKELIAIARLEYSAKLKFETPILRSVTEGTTK